MISTHCIRLGTHAEKEYLEKATAWYGEVMLNANLVEAASSASASLLQKLSLCHRPYTIDPVTYTLGLNPASISKAADEGWQLKRTFASLVKAYGLAGMNLPLTPSAIDGQVEDFAERVIDYQAETISKALENDAAFLAISDTMLPPVRYIAPYFDLSDASLTWLDTNLRLIAAGVIHMPEKTWAAVCIDGRIIDNHGLIRSIAKEYAQSECAGYLIWATDFNHAYVTESQIRGLQLLVSILNTTGRPVINMYGGYFAMLLHNDGLTGISHAVGYGERRSLITPAGGGMPPAKFYLRGIHSEITIDDLVQMTKQLDEVQYLTLVCDCLICVGLMDRGGLDNLLEAYGKTERKRWGASFRNFPAPEVYKLTRFHFMANRSAEVGIVNQAASRDALLEQLAEAYEQYEHRVSADLRFLRRWKSALTSPG